MLALFTVFFFIFGIIIGSFLNVVILRYNTGMGIDGRSQCFSCGKDLRWFELVPLFSYLILRGKCARCKSKISWQYPLVEFMTGIVFAFIFLKYSYLLAFSSGSFVIALLFTLTAASLLIVIFVYDLRHKIIPDGLVYALALLAFIRLFVEVPHLWTRGTAADFLAGPLLAAPFAILWLVSKGMWMGFGDAKLALAMGWILGIERGFTAVMFAFWIGAAVSLVIIVVQKARLRGDGKQLTMKSEIPFAPFLILGLALIFFLDLHLFGLSQFVSTF